MQNNDSRSFVDAVYGHIYIPKNYCQKIIDSLLYQRLRRIEQTSMRPLFPTAHHDRFSHSLGTYHIGSVIFHHIKYNTQKSDKELYAAIDKCHPHKLQQRDVTFWEEVEHTYKIACLLHDCGHAPFSHTFETYYTRFSADNDKYLRKDIVSAYNDTVEYLNTTNRCCLGFNEIKKIKQVFNRDFLNCAAKEHEMVSAWLCLHEKGFRNPICELGGDPLLVARMIMGCKYTEVQSFDARLANCFIGLLNGDEIDADRTDYAIRDKWATGLNTTTINLDRLFSSIHIAKQNGEPLVCFSKKSLPELESILEIKNYNSFWIFKHNKILYHERLLRKAVEKLALLFQGTEAIEQYIERKEQIGEEHELKADKLENEALYNFFDYHNLITPVHYTIKIDAQEYNEELFMLTDDDIVHLLKKYFCSIENTKNEITSEYLKKFYNRNNYAKEWLSRQHNLLPLWKSYVEFSTIALNNHYELMSLDLLINLLEQVDINKLPTNRIKDALNNEVLSDYLDKLKQLHGESNYTIAQLWTEYANDIDVNESKYFEWFNKIKQAHTYYRDNRDHDIRSAIENAINNIRQDGFTLIPDTYKFIRTDKFNIRPIKENMIHIDLLENGIFEYTKLGLPSKNSNKEYDFFYVYLPMLRDSTGQLVDKDKCRETYIKVIQTSINQIFHPLSAMIPKEPQN